MDRRIKYTKLRLKKSIVELLRDYPIEKITVKQLCETADINRSTFYAHYSDPFDLLQQLEQEVIDQLMEHISQSIFVEESENIRNVLDIMLKYIQQNADLFKVLLSENGDMAFQKDMMRITQQKSIIELKNNKNIDPDISSYVQSFEIAGGLSIVQKWLENGMVESTQRMSKLMTTLLYQGLSGMTS